jgi:hypothetical protein
MTLQAQPKTTIVYDNVEYEFHPYFNRVLTLLSEVFPSKELTDIQKIYITVSSLTNAPPKEGIFELIIHELFPKNKKADDQKTMDFEQDAALIYAAFLQAYGIDLYAVRNQMDWRIFIALLKGIPENTELSRIIKIRSMKVPERNEHNGDYVDSIINAKRAVALDEPIEIKKQRMAKKWLEIAEGLTNVRR